MSVLRKKTVMLFWMSISLIIRCFSRVKPNRILCWSYYGKNYSCNPYYITKYLLKKYPEEFEIYWLLNKDVDVNSIPQEVKIVRMHTLKYYYIINSAKYVICNARTNKWKAGWIKNNNQKYIMTWHSSMGIKKVEKDAEKELGRSYVVAAKYDSSKCDLILSGCKFRSSIIKNSFWYKGEILEKGTPRNDMLFDIEYQKYLKQILYKKFNISSNKKIILYAPTFRKDSSINCYKLNWNSVREVLHEKFGHDFIVFLRLHPNLINSGIDYSSLYNFNEVIDVTKYHDMQELLSISDILITDYSSSIFDFSLLYRPCFIYASDFTTYDRGTYLQLDQLPYPFAENEETLLHNIKNFDNTIYKNNLDMFLKKTIGSFENGHACESFYKWMKQN